MRWFTVIFSLFLFSCASAPDDLDSAVQNDLFVDIRDAVDSRSVTVVIKNVSVIPICISEDMITNPYSYDMNLDMKDDRGLDIQERPAGFLAPPMFGFSRLEPGQVLEAVFDLDARFGREAGRLFMLKETQLRAAFRYDYCDSTREKNSSSSWVKFSPREKMNE